MAATQDVAWNPPPRCRKPGNCPKEGNVTLDRISQDPGSSRPRTGGLADPGMNAVGLVGQRPPIPRTWRRRPPWRRMLEAIAAFLPRRSPWGAATGAGLLCGMALVVAPGAFANVDLAVGMPISIGQHGCSPGFFGFDARNDRLAVTAGHCSDYESNEPVFADNGVRIGEVVAWKQDQENTSGKLLGARGYTIISLYPRFSLEPFFTGIRS
jgi:hypothetical protein